MNVLLMVNREVAELTKAKTLRRQPIVNEEHQQQQQQQQQQQGDDEGRSMYGACVQAGLFGGTHE
jgi:hypothetical protein